jgi:hypothetical protein
MPKLLLRIATLFLVPALITEPVTAFPISNVPLLNSHIQSLATERFEDQALSALARMFPRPSTPNRKPSAKLDRMISAAAPKSRLDGSEPHETRTKKSGKIRLLTLARQIRFKTIISIVFVCFFAVEGWSNFDLWRIMHGHPRPPASSIFQSAEVNYLKQNKIDATVIPSWIVDKIERYRIVGIGDIHFTPPPSESVAKTLNMFYEKHPKDKLILGVEIPVRLQPDLDGYMDGRPPSDRLATQLEAWGQAVNTARELWREGKSIQVIAIDGRHFDSPEGMLSQDRSMLGPIVNALNNNPEAHALIFAGAEHVSYRENVIRKGSIGQYPDSPSLFYLLKQKFPGQTYCITSMFVEPTTGGWHFPANSLETAALRAGLDETTFGMEVSKSPFANASEQGLLYQLTGGETRFEHFSTLAYRLGSVTDGILYFPATFWFPGAGSSMTPPIEKGPSHGLSAAS